MSKANAYKKIIKTTSLFGSVQVFNLIVSIIRSKFLAIFIGPSGYGLYGLLSSTVELVRQISGFSIEVSGVKQISEASVNENKELINERSAILIKLSVITGFFGALLAMSLSPLLSLFTFGNSSKTLLILLISLSILFKQVFASKTAVMQGVSKLSYLAKTNLYSNFFGLIFTLLLYYFFSIDAIVPAIIISSLISLLVSEFYYKKLGLRGQKIKINEAIKKGKEVLLFGGLLALSSFLPALSNYLLQIFIGNEGGLTQVGLFNIGLVVINTYIGIIFIAMSTEYYPRLAAMNNDSVKESEAINSQAIISMLIIIPIVVFVLGFSSIIIKVLFSFKFMDVLPMISWAILGMFFKSVSFSMGYLIIARADSSVFTKTAVLFNGVYLLLCVLGYHFMGMEGIGIGTMLYFLIHLLGVYLIIKFRYDFRFSRSFLFILLTGIVFCLISILLYKLYNGYYKPYIFLGIFTISLLFSLNEIDKRIHIRNTLKTYLKRKKNGTENV